jgi:hypothetical protein
LLRGTIGGWFKGEIGLGWPWGAQPFEKIQHFSAFFPVGIGQIR